MIITTATTIALLCPNCGQLSWHVLSLFNLNRKHDFTCECGTPVLTIEKKKHYYWFRTQCAFCETEHFQPLVRQEILAEEPFELYCEEGDYLTGCLGPQEKVKEHLKKHRRSLTEVALEAGTPDFFQSPEVMFGILESLYETAQKGELACRCGSQQLEMEIFPDKVELRCQSCGVEIMVPALLPEDLENFLLAGLAPMGSLGLKNRSGKLQRKNKHIKSHLE